MLKSADNLLLNNDTLNEPSYEILFRECFMRFCTYYKYKFGFPVDTVKDLVHNAFVKLWENRGSVSAASAKAYLHKTITHAGLDLLKHEKVKQKHIHAVLHARPAEQVEADFDTTDYLQLSRDVRKAVAGLSQQMRHIFELSRNEGLKYAEIADRLHISVKTVECQMSRALAKLRAALSQYLTSLVAGFFLLKIFLKLL